MKLILYKIKDDRNVVNKTIGDGLELNINFKSDVNIVSPDIFLMTLDKVNFKDYNYCYIDVLDRYYFIDSVVSINNRVDHLQCTCDVVETYKKDFLNVSAKYQIEAQSGDYGVISADTNNVLVKHIESDKAIKFQESILISTVEL